MSKTSWVFRWLVFPSTPLLVMGAYGAGCGLDDGDVVTFGSADSGVDAAPLDATGPDAASDSGDSGDPCASDPCLNGATCANDGGAFACTCAAGYSGTTCATNIDDCRTTDGGNPCENGGTCTDGVAAYSCSCVAGFTGKNCETNVNECAANPCAHGTCTDGANTYTCTCTTGYQGANCDSCAADYYSYPTCTFCSASTTCGGNGTCSTTGGCTCAAGFAGPACQYSNATTCSGHGTAKNDGTCTCTAGFSGASCNVCATNYYSYPTCTFCDAPTTCGGHGACSATGTCICTGAYSGPTCGTFTGTYAGSAHMPNANNNTDTAPQYGQVNGTAAFSTSSADNRVTPGVATTLTKLTLATSAADIGSRTWTGTIMKNGTATALTCQIADSGKTCTVTANVALSATDAINIQVQQSDKTQIDRTATWSIDYTQP